MFPDFVSDQQAELRIILHYSLTHPFYESNQYALPPEKTRLDDEIGILDDSLIRATSSHRCKPGILVNQIMETCLLFLITVVLITRWSDLMNHNDYMQIALDELHAGVKLGLNPVGSIIVRQKDGEIIGRGRNLVPIHNDPTAHAEMVAIRQACDHSGLPKLTDCTLYTTLEPCPMCCWAILTAGIEQLVLGARLTVIKKVNYGDYTVENLVAMTNANITITTGIREEECARLRSAWELR